MNYGLVGSINTSLGKKFQHTEYNIITAYHKFLWDESNNLVASVENKIAKDYHDQLFKEYCISDLTHFKTKQIALRWRTKKEVISGKGEFTCGDRKCNLTNQLKSWEVNFKYNEHGKSINALVKLRLCKECSKKLNYYTRKKESCQEENNISKGIQKKHESLKEKLEIKKIDNEVNNKQDTETLWTNQSLDKINMNLNKKINDYLLDLFQFM